MPEQAEQKIDFRLYIGLFFFYWQTIAVCFLYCLLAGVLYVRFAPKQYETSCKLMVHRDTNLEIASVNDRYSPWRSFKIHSYFLQSEDLRKGVAEELVDKWGETMGSIDDMMLGVDVAISREVGSTLDISVRSKRPAYAEDFLLLLVEKHQQHWMDIQHKGSESATEMLEKELAKISEDIEHAENDLIEYQRLHDIARVEATASMESQYLSALMARKSMLTTELMLLESQYPMLKGANAAVISDVGRLTRETGEIEPELEDPEEEGDDAGKSADRSAVRRTRNQVKLPDELTKKALPGANLSDGAEWRNLRIKLLEYQKEEAELLKDLESAHPRVKALREKIDDIETKLSIAAKSEVGRLKDRHKALMIQKDAVEKAIYSWQAKNLLSSKRQSELNRLSNVLERYQRNYETLYARLHDMRITQEMKAEHFRTIQDVKTEDRPVWPDPLKVLVVALVVGIGSGLGIAVAGHTLNNKIQTISDVEKELNVPFLGGVPYWVRSGLEQMIRPIVTEEFSTGATEAYRSLRTAVLAEMDKEHEKVVLVTSADSREGKTLTTLNLAIMIAQMGKKVLLIDMDLRRGRLHRSLGLEREPGMTGVLEGRYELADVVRETRLEGLFLAASGKSIDNTAELLQTRDIKTLFSEVYDDYDYIFIDSSPVLRVTDTVIMASQKVAPVIYVARVNKTPKPMIQYSLGLLEGAKVLGLIMNSIEMHRISSLYYAYQYPAYAYYSNAYAYGYDYYDDKGGRGKLRGKKRRRKTSWRRRWHSFERWLKRTFLPME